MLHRNLLLAFALNDLIVIIILYVYPAERNGDPLVGSKDKAIRVRISRTVFPMLR